MIFDLWGEKRRRTVTPGDKNYLIRRARGKCEYCGGEIISKGIVPEIHHIVPHASGGSDREHNLIVLCPNCHSKVDHIAKATLRLKISYRLPKQASVEKSPAKTKPKPKKSSTTKAKPKKAVAKVRPKKTTAAKAKPKKSTSTKTSRRKTAASKASPKKTTNMKTRTRKTITTRRSKK